MLKKLFNLGEISKTLESYSRPYFSIKPLYTEGPKSVFIITSNNKKHRVEVLFLGEKRFFYCDRNNIYILLIKIVEKGFITPQQYEDISKKLESSKSFKSKEKNKALFKIDKCLRNKIRHLGSVKSFVKSNSLCFILTFNSKTVEESVMYDNTIYSDSYIEEISNKIISKALVYNILDKNKYEKMNKLKRWESPRKRGRNNKGKGGTARARQLKKREKLLRKKLKA